MKLYQVLDWNDNFENSKSRERKECGFVCVPNRQSGLGFSRLMAHKQGASIYGVWCLLLGALSRQSRVDGKGREGWLTHDGHPTGIPWAVEDLALLFRRPDHEISCAIELLASPSIGWIKAHDYQQEAFTARPLPAHCPDGIVKERKKEEKGIAAAPLPFSSASFMKSWSDWVEHLKQKRVKTTEKAVSAQLEKCLSVGEARATAMINHSIASNWQGLFEDSKSAPRASAVQNFDDLSSKRISS